MLNPERTIANYKVASAIFLHGDDVQLDLVGNNVDLSLPEFAMADWWNLLFQVNFKEQRDHQQSTVQIAHTMCS